jgi:hypothetical protein
LESLFGPKYRAFAVTNGEIRGEVMKIFDQTFLITYPPRRRHRPSPSSA